MPIMQTMYLKGSVGTGGRNQHDDVRAVQRQLNGQMSPPRKPLTEDGLSGPKTESMIRDFQRSVCKFRRPDGRVDPGGKTMTALNDPRSEGVWAQMSMHPDALAPVRKPPTKTGSLVQHDMPESDGLSTQERAVLETLWKQARNDPRLQGDPQAQSFFLIWLDEMVTNELQDAKALLGAQGVLAQLAQSGKLVEFVKGVDFIHGYYFRNWQATAKWLTNSARLNGTLTTMRGVVLIGSDAKVPQFFKSMGTKANVLAVVFMVPELVNHLRKGDYGPAAREIVKTSFSIGVPVAGLVDGLFSAIDRAYPGLSDLKTGSEFYIVMRSFNIIDHTGNAADAIGTFVSALIKARRNGYLATDELDELLKRLRSSSANTLIYTVEDITRRFL